MEKHASQMIGSPPGYVGHEEGGQLTERIKRMPYSLILLDEIEKAHPDVFNILLQVLEDGMITDAYGEVVDFKNTIVIMTSNIGSQHVARTGGRLGFKGSEREQEFKDRRDLVMAELRRTLSPEFINQLDEIIVFDALSEEQLKKIARIMVERLNLSLQQRGIQLVVAEEVCAWMVRATASDRAYGARRCAGRSSATSRIPCPRPSSRAASGPRPHEVFMEGGPSPSGAHRSFGLNRGLFSARGAAAADPPPSGACPWPLAVECPALSPAEGA